MSFIREAGRAIRVALILWLITGIIFPLVMVGVGQVLFNKQANGSIIESQGKVIGSELIGQNFTSERYFLSRPSMINYSSFTAEEYDPKNLDNIAQRTGVSGASNLAPSNTAELLKDSRDAEAADLLKRIRSDVDRLKQAGIQQPTVDLVYTSGSGLDPHISVDAALAQVDRIAKVRFLPADQVQALVAKNTDGRFLGIFGEPGVNVLKLNLALDALDAAIQ